MERDPSRFYQGDNVEVTNRDESKWVPANVDAVAFVGDHRNGIVSTYTVMELGGGERREILPAQIRQLRADWERSRRERLNVSPKLTPADDEFRRDFASRALLVMLESPGDKHDKVRAAVAYADLLLAELAREPGSDE